MTLGYDTAVNSCIDDIRSIRATSRSHDRPGVVEVMGRHCGDIALKAAAGSGAEICLVPEVSWSIQEAADRLSRLIDMGNPRATVVVAEGAWDSMQPRLAALPDRVRRKGHSRRRSDQHRKARAAAQA